MDMADAVNIMLYAAPRPDGGDGVAAWDIYQADDAQKIRNFLRKHFVEARGIDPIHSQLFYLDSELRSKLHKEYGVVAHRIYQRPGDAVFIPAGCAHQVSGSHRYRNMLPTLFQRLSIWRIVLKSLATSSAPRMLNVALP